MDMLVKKLDAKLREWRPNTVAEVRGRVVEIIDLADHGCPGYHAIAFRRTGGSKSTQ